MSASQSAMTEQITWRECQEEKPDADETVLINHEDWDEPVWIGYWDSEVWRTVEDKSLDQKAGELAPPQRWAPMPVGPNQFTAMKTHADRAVGLLRDDAHVFTQLAGIIDSVLVWEEMTPEVGEKLTFAANLIKSRCQPIRAAIAKAEGGAA